MKSLLVLSALVFLVGVVCGQLQPLAQQPPQIRVSTLVLVPDSMVFLSGVPQEREVLLYNFGNVPVKWSLGPASKFLRIDASGVPNPLPPTQGAMLKVSVNWELVPDDAGTIQKPGSLIAILEKLFNVDIPDRYKHLGVGLFSVRNETTKGVHIVTVFTVLY